MAVNDETPLLDRRDCKAVESEHKKEDEQTSVESSRDYNARWKSIRVLYLTLFTMSVEYTVVMAALWPYLREVDANVSAQFLGLVNGGYSIGGIIGSFFFGACTRYCNLKIPFIGSLLLLAFGSLLYIMPQSFPGKGGLNLILSARILIGFAGGVVASCRAELAQATSLDERAKAFANMTTFQATGLFAGPALQLLMGFLGKHSTYAAATTPNFSAYTAPGFVGLGMALVNAAAVLIWLKKFDVCTQTETKGNAPKPDMVAVVLVLLMFFVSQTVFSIFDTITSPLLIDEFALSNIEAVFYGGVVLTSTGLVFVVMLQILRHLPSRIKERTLITLGFMIHFMVHVIFIPWGNVFPKQQTINIIKIGNLTQSVVTTGCNMKYSWCKTTPQIRLPQYVTGALLFSIGFPLTFLFLNVLYSKVVGPRKQGLYMGAFAGFGAFARVLGPIIVTNAYTQIGPRWTFFSMDVLLLITLVLLFYNYNRLDPSPYFQQETKK